MNCRYCHGVDTIQEELTEFCSWQRPTPFVVENIPALVCIQCTETIFPGKLNLGHLLGEIRAGRVAPTTVRAVPFYDFQQARSGESPQPAVQSKDAQSGQVETLYNSHPLPMANLASSYQLQPLLPSSLLMYGNRLMSGYQPYTASPKDLLPETASSYAVKSAMVR